MAKRPRMKWYGEKAVKIAVKAGMDVLMTGGEAILTDAINETPVDTGTLRRSGTVTLGALPDSGQIYEAAKAGKDHQGAFKEEIGREKAVYVSFNTPYARRQHEELGYNHPLGGGPKYLENPFNRLKGKVRRMAELRVKKALREKR